MLSRIWRHGRLRLGNGASQSVRTLRTLCSRKANCRSRLISWLITDLSIEIFLVAGRFSMFKSRSSSAACRMFWRSCAMRSSLSLIKLMSPRLRRRVFPSRQRAKISSKSDWNSRPLKVRNLNNLITELRTQLTLRRHHGHRRLHLHLNRWACLFLLVSRLHHLWARFLLLRDLSR